MRLHVSKRLGQRLVDRHANHGTITFRLGLPVSIILSLLSLLGFIWGFHVFSILITVTIVATAISSCIEYDIMYSIEEGEKKYSVELERL